MGKIIITYCEDWADEFDLEYTALMSEEDFDKYIEDLPEEVTVRANLGNVDAENEHTKLEFVTCLSVTKITDAEYDVLSKFNYASGNCNAFDIDE
jgi:hypothetical protein